MLLYPAKGTLQVWLRISRLWGVIWNICVGPIVTGSAKREAEEESQLLEMWQQKQEAAAFREGESEEVPGGPAVVKYLPSNAATEG